MGCGSPSISWGDMGCPREKKDNGNEIVSTSNTKSIYCFYNDQYFFPKKIMPTQHTRKVYLTCNHQSIKPTVKSRTM
jgi:hypothetical protein